MIIKNPLVSEKTITNYKKNNEVAFEVDVNTNKLEVEKAVEKIYGVEVLQSRVNNRMGKYKMDRQTRRPYKNRDKKIVILKLKSGSKIDIFEKGE